MAMIVGDGDGYQMVTAVLVMILSDGNGDV